MDSTVVTSKANLPATKYLWSLMLALVILCVAAATSFATTVSLQWDSNTTPNVAGYKVYYNPDSSTAPFTGTGAAQGASPIKVGNLTSTTISGLDSSHSYYIAVTAYDASGNESPYSNFVTIPEAVPPTVSITSPAGGSSVSGTVSVAASASDNVGVTKVEFYVNGVLQGSDTASPYVFTWNTASLASGTYTLSAKAYDAAGNVGQSSNLSVSVVNDTTPPTVSISSPASGATVNGTATITASASDNIGVTKVEFYGNGTLLSATNVSPYTYSWNTSSVANGSYTLTAKAYDAAGNIGQSSNVTVTVSNGSAVAVSTATLPESYAGSAYSSTLAATGGTAPYTWALASGTLPTGLTLSSGGTISGTSTTSGTYSFSVKATDASGAVATKPLSLTANANVALLATATASSQNTSTGQLASKAIDNVISGYPTNPNAEWATVGQVVGAWIQLNFSKSYTVDRIVLYDRPNLTDWVQGGTLTFSDGTSLTVGQLANNGTATTINFPAKSVTWVKFTVTSAQGSNIGLSEFKVFGR